MERIARREQVPKARSEAARPEKKHICIIIFFVRSAKKCRIYL
jgi:hypothetical protein